MSGIAAPTSKHVMPVGPEREAVSFGRLTHLQRLEAESIHIWKFRDMITFRDETAKRLGLDLLVYEEPERPEMRIDTTRLTPEQAAEVILERLRRTGVFGAE